MNEGSAEAGGGMSKIWEYLRQLGLENVDLVQEKDD
jgi:hypothetical protein